MKHVTDELVLTGEYQLPFDTSPRRRWFSPLALFFFAVLFVAVRYAYVSASFRSTVILLSFSFFFLFLLPLCGTFMVPFTRKYPAILVFFKIFGIPFVFLGFLSLLMLLP